ncbi:helix-turn-helix domain-containing protein [Candidatus Enterococcus willemsii]|uniref:Mga helix-turn-helix domain-containing protein n=1 Tax=Candidatus Enterococcus willemsii TaxID=1857215 RepID=A0ABQ6YYZ3_9ENTE|nr:helix-turn-helix domain-containing protein [Enterococcus sp. CU12B]KAF1303491.1 hypothetical protein BAU17_12335 [Enterococcus sp. CU12B]
MKVNMFGFPKDIQLKHDMLLYLDQQSDFISSELIAESVGKVTAQTIRKKLNELAADIKQLYAPNKVSLEIDTRYGVKLIRKGANLTQVFEKLYENSFVYAIFKLLIQQRSFSTDDFCSEYNISFSKLRRAVNQINAFLENYEIRIIAGQRVSIEGKESQIRCLFFMFLFYVHRQATSVRWIAEDAYLDLAEKLCYSLYIPIEKGTLEVIALWLYIQDVSKEPVPSLDRLSLSEQIPKSIPRPSFLTDFDDNEWDYFLLVLYGLNLVNTEIFQDFDIIHQNDFFDVARKFIDNFDDLSILEKHTIFQTFHQIAILNEIIPLDMNLLAVFSPVSMDGIEHAYPALNTRFQQLWSELISEFPAIDTEFYHRRIFLLFLQIVPSSEVSKPLCLYICSNFSLDIVEGMKRRIKNFFKSKFLISYTKNISQADFVISTEDVVIESEKEVLIVSPKLTVKDFLFLDSQF